MSELRGPWGPLAPPQYLADQLTLFQLGRADYPHLLLLTLARTELLCMKNAGTQWAIEISSNE